MCVCVCSGKGDHMRTFLTDYERTGGVGLKMGVGACRG